MSERISSGIGMRPERASRYLRGHEIFGKFEIEPSETGFELEDKLDLVDISEREVHNVFTE